MNNSMRKLLLTVVTCYFFISLSACWVHKDTGDRIQRDVKILNAQYDSLKTELERQKHILDKKLVEADKRLSELNAAQKKFDSSQRHLNANIGVELDTILQNMQQLNGQLETNEHRISQLQNGITQLQQQMITKSDVKIDKKNGENKPDNNNEKDLEKIKTPVNPDELFQLAQSEFSDKKYDTAIILFRDFLAKWPKHKKWCSAQYYIGESSFLSKNYRSSIIEFDKVRQECIKSNKIPEALYKMGYSFNELNMKKEAITFLEELISKYKKSEASVKAKKLISSIKKNTKKK